MNSFAVISDLHFGIKNNSSVFLNRQTDFLNNEFIPEVKRRNISNIIVAGDIFDNRNSVNIKIQNAVIDLFKSMNDFMVYVIVGNHDLFYSDSNNVYSTKFLTEFKNVNVINCFSQKDIGGVKCSIFPWIKRDDFINIIDKFKFEEYNVCIGHFDIKGFKMHQRNPPSIDGFPSELFYNNFGLTISGHFHIMSDQEKNGNKIVYVGSPFQLTRNDSGDFKGYMVFNFEGQKLINSEFINSKNIIKYVQVVYPDYTFVTEEHIKGNIVDIIVDYSLKFNETKLIEYKGKVESFNPAEKPEIKIVNKSQINVSEEVNKNAYESTIALINEYVNECSFVEPKDKDIVLKNLHELYKESGAE